MIVAKWKRWWQGHCCRALMGWQMELIANMKQVMNTQEKENPYRSGFKIGKFFTEKEK